jgi:hypothetical protein
MGNMKMENQPTSGNQTGSMQIGYFSHLRIEEKHMGAVLVTNQVGIPLEFKYTDPVSATKLHKILYGSSLEKYLHEVVIRDRLSKEIRSQPEFYIAPYEEKEFLGVMAGKEMMAVQKINAMAGESSGPFTRVRDREAIIELEDGPSLRLAFSSADEETQHRMVTWLQEIGLTMDILEPMDRVNSALMAICGEAKKA